MAKEVSTIKIESSADPDVTKSHVILAQFENGKLRSLDKPKVKFDAYKSNTVSRKRILVAKSSRMCYQGSNFESSLYNITSSVLKVGVLNRKESTVKLFDADYFLLKPILKCPEIISCKSEKTYIEKSSDLTLAFGSKIQQKKVNTNMKYATSTSKADSVDDIVTSISETTQDVSKTNEASNSTMSSIIPPQNSTAVKVEDVYSIDDIITKEEYENLKLEAEVYHQATRDTIQLWKKENKYPDFIIQFLDYNISNMNIHKAKLLCYLNYMFHFLRTTYADWKKKYPVPEVPEPYRSNLMDSFTIKKSLPMRLKDKLLAYALVLALKLNNNVMNGSVFASSAKIPMKRLTTVAYALGCHVTDSKMEGMKKIELKLPLYKFQPLPPKKGKK